MKTLILIPTDLERRQLSEPLSAALTADDRVELCGFGPIAAAARTADLLAARRPTRVLLVGIAGGLDPQLAVGTACTFSAVGCDGVGAGSGDAFLPAADMGWPQWPGDPPDPEVAVSDVLACGWPNAEPAGESLLLTVCAAAASPAEVAARQGRFPTAVAEDMEGFGVAVACRLARVPLQIVRGLSNWAGNRDVATWQISQALAEAGRLAHSLLKER